MKSLIQRLIGYTGYELHRKAGSRSSLAGIFAQLRAQGLSPAVIVDAGAAFGDWTRAALPYFPNASYYLFEPLAEYAPAFAELPREFPRAEIRTINALLGASAGEKTIHVHADLVGSSVYQEVESADLLVTESRAVPCVSLDAALTDAPAGPVFIKVDAQGAELDILAGAHATLARAEAVQLEVSLVGSIQGAPLFDEVIATLEAKGFVPYDFTNFSYRPLDSALAQVDVIFVRRDGSFRKEHAFATPEQREAQNMRFQRNAMKRLQKI